MARETERESWGIKLADSTKGTGTRMSETEELLSDTQMEIHTMAASKMAKLMERECTPGITERFTMENGTKVSNMAMAYGGAFTVILISGSGVIRKLKAMACTLGKTEIATKASGDNAWSTGKALIYSRTQIFIQENIKKASPMGKASILGKTVRFISENSNRVLNMERASGRVARDPSATSMKETMPMTKSMAAGFSIGQVETAIRESTERTNAMGSEKWFGRMEAHIKGSGTGAFNMAKVKWSFQTERSKKVSLS
jgi:hypothetical protein